MDAGPLLGSRPRVVHDLDHAALRPAAGDGAEAAGERLVQVVRADGQHRRSHVTRDRLRQRIGELREGADDGRVVLVAPPRDQPRREEEDDRLGHGEAQRWQEELAIDPVVAAPGLEDRNAQLLVEGVEVAVHGAGGHPGQPGDLADGDTGLGPALRVEDRDDAQQPRQPIALARDPVVATITPARPTVSLVQHGADDRPTGVSPRQTRWVGAATASPRRRRAGRCPLAGELLDYRPVDRVIDADEQEDDIAARPRVDVRAGGRGVVLEAYPDPLARHHVRLPRLRVEAGDPDVAARSGQVWLEILGRHLRPVDAHRVQRHAGLLHVGKGERREPVADLPECHRDVTGREGELVERGHDHHRTGGLGRDERREVRVRLIRVARGRLRRRTRRWRRRRCLGRDRRGGGCGRLGRRLGIGAGGEGDRGDKRQPRRPGRAQRERGGRSSSAAE